MSAIHQQNIAFRHKIVVVFDIGSKVSVGLLAKGIGHEGRARATTQSHFFDHPSRQSGMFQARRANFIGNKIQKPQSSGSSVEG